MWLHYFSISAKWICSFFISWLSLICRFTIWFCFCHSIFVFSFTSEVNLTAPQLRKKSLFFSLWYLKILGIVFTFQILESLLKLLCFCTLCYRQYIFTSFAPSVLVFFKHSSHSYRTPAVPSWMAEHCVSNCHTSERLSEGFRYVLNVYWWRKRNSFLKMRKKQLVTFPEGWQFSKPWRLSSACLSPSSQTLKVIRYPKKGPKKGTWRLIHRQENVNDGEGKLRAWSHCKWLCEALFRLHSSASSKSQHAANAQWHCKLQNADL